MTNSTDLKKIRMDRLAKRAHFFKLEDIELREDDSESGMKRSRRDVVYSENKLHKHIYVFIANQFGSRAYSIKNPPNATYFLTFPNLFGAEQSNLYLVLGAEGNPVNLDNLKPYRAGSLAIDDLLERAK